MQDAEGSVEASPAQPRPLPSSALGPALGTPGALPAPRPFPTAILNGVAPLPPRPFPSGAFGALNRRAGDLGDGGFGAADGAISLDQVKADFDGDGQDDLKSLIMDLDRKITDRFDQVQASLERKLTDRFDQIESSLEEIGKQMGAPHPSPEAALPVLSNSQRSLAVSEKCATVIQKCTSLVTHAGKVADAAPSPVSKQPPHFSLRKEWQSNLSSVNSRNSTSEEVFKALEENRVDDEESVDPGSLLKPWYILWPSSYFRLSWDLTTMALVAHDMAVIPVHMGFSTDENIVTKSLFWPFLLFWTADIPLTFLTGYYRKGHVETSLFRIAKNYILTWFLLDMAMVSSSWTEAMSTTQALIGINAEGLELGRVGKTLRILRIVRSMRLLRLVKLKKILEDIQDRITSEYFHIIIAVMKLSVIIVWTNHFIACTWWGIGASGPKEGDPDAGSSWTSHFGFQSEPFPYKYFTSLHWSLTQFTPASMEITPRNLGERMFAVWVLIFAMIVFSSFVSSITAAMTQLRNLGKPVDKSFVILRRYLRGRKVPAELNQRIIRCVQNGLKNKKEEIPESDVDLLKFLSATLHMELLSHVYGQALLDHPFFRTYQSKDQIAMQRVCMRAVKRICYASGDVLFTQACTGDCMFFVQSGKFRYLPERKEANGEESRPAEIRLNTPSTSIASFNRTRSKEFRTDDYSLGVGDTTVGAGEWFCEPCLWTPWAHTGSMRALVFCEVLVVNPVELAKITSVRRLVQEGAQRYGEAYIQRLNHQAGNGSVISDVNTLDPDVIEELAEQAFLGGTPFTAEPEDLQDPQHLHQPHHPHDPDHPHDAHHLHELADVEVKVRSQQRERHACCHWLTSHLFNWRAGGL